MKILAKERIVVHLRGSHRPFERGLDMAYSQALTKFGIDENGHSDKVDGWARSCCGITIKFKKMTFSGDNTTLVFKAICHCEYE